jgi:hypothetical protein
MFIELHKPDSSAIAINLDKLECFVPADNGKHAMVSLPDYNGWLYVEESYEQIKELIIECQKK